MSRREGNSQTQNNAANALCTAYAIIQILIDSKRNFNNSGESDSLSAAIQAIAEKASFDEKKAFCYFLYCAVEIMKEEPNPNSLASDNLHLMELYFRRLCKPLFNSLSSFLPEDKDVTHKMKKIKI